MNHLNGLQHNPRFFQIRLAATAKSVSSFDIRHKESVAEFAKQALRNNTPDNLFVTHCYYAYKHLKIAYNPALPICLQKNMPVLTESIREHPAIGPSGIFRVLCAIFMFD